MAGGSLLGAIATNLTGDRFGRRDSLALGCVVWVIGCAIMASVQNVPQLIVSRVINGFAVGIFSCQAPLYIAEISKPDRRGRLIAFQNWMIAWGTLIIYLISYGTSFINGTASFRIPWGLQMIPALVLLCCIPFMPRSPRWLASKDRWEDAHDVLALLHARGDRYEPLVLAELQQIKDKIFFERENGSTSWFELFRRRNVMRTQAAVCAHLWSQFSGNNALMYYIVSQAPGRRLPRCTFMRPSSLPPRPCVSTTPTANCLARRSTYSRWPASAETSSLRRALFSTASVWGSRSSPLPSWTTIDDDMH